MIAPALEEIGGAMNGQGVPTLTLFKNGELASRQMGGALNQELEQ
jgi:hypothetical protein